MDKIKDLEKVEAFIKVLLAIPGRYQQLYEQVGSYDRETSDCLHDIEFDHFYRTGGHRKARYLQKIRKERRRAKEEMEQLCPIKDVIKKGSESEHFIQEIREALTKVNEVVELQKNRTYRPRVRDDLNIVGQHFDTSEGRKYHKAKGSAKVITLGELRNIG